ncbi:MAG: sorbosone dehydrogenase family protein [Parvibaculaceae bacterium]
MADVRRAARLAVLLSGCLVLVPLAGCDEGSDFDISRQIGPDPVLPEPSFALMTNLKVAEVIGWKDGEMPSVPDGLAITAYARDLANPRALHTLPNGDVLVAQARGPAGEPVSRPKDFIRDWIMSFAHGSQGEEKKSNLVTLLRDANRDGKVDERHDLLTGLASPFGLAWSDDTLYVATTEAILSYPYRLGDTKIAGPAQVLTPLPGGPIDHHWTKDLALSPDGRFLYVSVGSNSNIVENGLEAEKGRAAIWQVDRETGASRVFASGLRNPNGLTFHPQTRTLWAVVNERDELGPNLVPDYMTSVREGAFYGWPWSYYGQHVDERVRPQRPDMVERAIAPDYALSSHVAPLGMTFALGSALPEPFRDGAFVGEHGSWNRDSFNGYKVVYIPFTDGSPSGKAQDVVTGFIDGERAHGRPVGLGIDGTGALLIADDAGNTVWRVAAADGSVTPKPMGTDQVAMALPAGRQQGQIGGEQNSRTGGQPVQTTKPSQDTPRASFDEQVTGQEPAPSSSGKTSPTPSQTEIAPATLPK